MTSYARRSARMRESIHTRSNRNDSLKDRSTELNHMLLTRLRLRHFALLSRIAKHRTLSRVADEMNMSQPAITKALKDVEDIFMTQLFERSPRGLIPTAAGEAVLKYAATALADVNMTAHQLSAIEAGLQGRVRIGVIPHAPEALLEAVLTHLLTQNPRISVVVREAVTEELVSALQAHELDCAIGRSVNHDDDAGILQEAIYDQSPCLLISTRAYDRVARRPLDWGALAELSWILQSPTTPMRRMVSSIFAGAGVPSPVPVVETYSLKATETAFRILPDAITVLARDMAEKIANTGACRLLPYELNWSLPPICLLLPKAVTVQPMLEAVLVAIRNSAKQLALARRVHVGEY